MKSVLECKKGGYFNTRDNVRKLMLIKNPPDAWVHFPESYFSVSQYFPYSINEDTYFKV